MTTSPAPPTVEVDEAATIAADDDVMLLDVREYDEWMAGHAPQAQHIPMSELQSRRAELPLDRRIICVCRSGNRSGQVTAWLQQQGYRTFNLTGGMQRWASSGHPVVNHAGNPGTVI